MSLGIDIAVGGRFHADRLAAVLLGLGHDVHLWSTFPRSRFDLPPERIHSNLFPEVVFRLARKLGIENRGDLFKMASFGRSSSRALRARAGREIFIGWSSFALESLRSISHDHRVIVRDSAHLRAQLDILKEEYARFGLRLPNRSRALAREEEEYALADTVVVLSRFAQQSFEKQGVASHKLRVLPLGADTRLFQPLAKDRITLPLKVVYFGSVSIRKGVTYLLDAMKKLPASEAKLTVIGPVEAALSGLRAKHPEVEWLASKSHAELARLLPTFDVFVLPTLEDGFGQTLVQAMACGLVPISTDRCGAAEVLEQGVDGFVVPAGSSGAIASILQQLAQDPEKFYGLRSKVIAKARSLDWRRYEVAIQEWMHSIAHIRKGEVSGRTLQSTR